MTSRILVAILAVVAKPLINGILWALGAAIGEAMLHRKAKDWINMIARTRLLFHPSVTRVAVFCSALLNLAGLLSALGAATGAWQAVLGDHRGLVIASACILLGIFCAQIAGWGRSTIPAVDANITPAVVAPVASPPA